MPEEMEILKTWGRRVDCYSILRFLGLKEFSCFGDFLGRNRSVCKIKKWKIIIEKLGEKSGILLRSID